MGQASPQPIVMTTSARAHGLVGEGLGELLAEVDPQLGHRLDDRRIDRLGRVGAGRAHAHPPFGPMVQEPGGDLRATCVVDADEEDLRPLVQQHPALVAG